MSDEGNNGEIPEGDYVGTCTGEVLFGVSSTGGKQVALEIVLMRGDSVWSILAFAGKAWERSISKLKACGWNQSGEIGPAIKGNEVRVKITYRVWEHDRRMNVDILDGAARFAFSQEMTESERSNFLQALTAGAPAAANDNGYPQDWDAPPPPAPAPTRGGFSLNKPRAA